MRYIEMPVKFTLLPVGGMPMYSPWWVAWALQWATTLSLSAMRSSMVLSKSGKPRRTLAASCFGILDAIGSKEFCCGVEVTGMVPELCLLAAHQGLVLIYRHAPCS